MASQIMPFRITLSDLYGH